MGIGEDEYVDSLVREQHRERRSAKLEKQKRHQRFRERVWAARDGRRLTVKDMGDTHLYNAYRVTGSKTLFKEMVMRLFEERLHADK